MKTSKRLLSATLILFLLNGVLLSILNRHVQRGLGLKRQMDTLQSDVLSYDVLAREYDELKGNLNQLIETLPSSYSEYAAFAEDLSKSATLSGVVMVIGSDDLTKSAKPTDAKNAKVPVSLELSGRYPQMVEFFNRLDGIPYYFSIKEMAMDKKEDTLITTVKLDLSLR